MSSTLGRAADSFQSREALVFKGKVIHMTVVILSTGGLQDLVAMGK
jgi:hypothetical protein